jgi:hypothetical protein
VALRILAVATLLAAAALGLGVVEKSIFVAMPHYETAVCIGQDVLYLMSDRGAGVAISAFNGSLLGYIKIPNRVDCVASGDKLYLLTEDGLYVFDKTLRELQRVKLDGRIYIPPWLPLHKIHVLTLREDKLYIVVHRDDGVFLVVLDANDLRLLETHRLAGEDCIYFDWGLARGDEVVAYGRCFIDGHNISVGVIVKGSERKTVGGADLVLSLRGQLYVVSDRTH